MLFVHSPRSMEVLISEVLVSTSRSRSVIVDVDVSTSEVPTCEIRKKTGCQLETNGGEEVRNEK